MLTSLSYIVLTNEPSGNYVVVGALKSDGSVVSIVLSEVTAEAEDRMLSRPILPLLRREEMVRM